VSLPELGIFGDPSRVVRGPDEELYVGATFFRSAATSFLDVAALYRLDAVDQPLVTWEGRLRLVGVGSDLRGVADRPTGQAVRLLVDGTFEELQYPLGTENMEGGDVTSISESGYAVGSALVPGTIGDAASLWTPSGEHSFLENGGVASSVRDRNDGSGINIGWSGSDVSSKIQLGGSPPIQPRKPNGDLIFLRDPLVSEGDFAVLGMDGFQPGLVRGQPDVALPIEQIFPELSSVDIDSITDVTSVEDHIFMTLSGDDGLYLFGAPAPVSIPEPQALALAILTLAFGIVLLHARPARSKSGASPVFNA
jgi:hypothetical protein